VPIAIAETTPEALTVATERLPEFQAPPAGALPSVAVSPAQILFIPVIAIGVVFTLTTLITLHAEPIVYEMMEVPAIRPVTTPVVAFTVAFVVLLLAHVPPVVVEFRVTVVPVHKVVGPVIASGSAFTVIVAVINAPEYAVNVTVAIPTEIGVISPEEMPIVATVLSLIVHD
jgi:hypothetical protein